VTDPTDSTDVDIRAAVSIADGSLSGERGAHAQAALNATPGGRRALEQQQRVIRALRAGGPAPSPGLQVRIATQSARPAHRLDRTLGRPTLALGVLATLLAVAVLLAVSGGPKSQPSVAAALELGTRPATAPAPQPLAAHPTLLTRSVDGVAFPNWARAHVMPIAPFTWTPAGARSDRLDGRRTQTVFYTHMEHHIAYTIVAGSALDPPTHARQITLAGHHLWELRDGDRDVVVFTRQGHTCVLAGHVISRDTLERLATWRGQGTIHF
jgi:hypothetical protein